MKRRNTFLALLAFGLAILIPATSAYSQGYPAKPLRMVVGFPPGGQVDMIISALPPALPLARTGKVRIIAATTRERIRSLPDLATVAEQGIAGYEIFTWYGVFATGGSPEAAIERLGAEIRSAVADPKVRGQLDKQGVDAASSTPAEFRAFYLREIEKWGRAVKLAGIKPD